MPFTQCVSGREREGLGMVSVSRLFVRQVAGFWGLIFWLGDAGSMVLEMGRVRQSPAEVE